MAAMSTRSPANARAAPDDNKQAEKRNSPIPALPPPATVVFVTGLTETLPAGVLRAVGADLGSASRRWGSR